MTKSRILVAGLLLVLVLGVPFFGAGASATEQCQSVEEQRICIEDVSLPEDPFVLGEQGEFSVTLANTGNQSAMGTVMLYTASPENETSAYRVESISLRPGDQTTVSRAINASTAGTHGLRFAVVEPQSQAVYDISSVHTIEILEEHPKQLGGPIDRTEIALVALLGSLCCLLGFG